MPGRARGFIAARHLRKRRRHAPRHVHHDRRIAPVRQGDRPLQRGCRPLRGRPRGCGRSRSASGRDRRADRGPLLAPPGVVDAGLGGVDARGVAARPCGRHARGRDPRRATQPPERPALLVSVAEMHFGVGDLRRTRELIEEPRADIAAASRGFIDLTGGVALARVLLAVERPGVRAEVESLLTSIIDRSIDRIERDAAPRRRAEADVRF